MQISIVEDTNIIYLAYDFSASLGTSEKPPQLRLFGIIYRIP